jgi:hypothetical protein
VSSFMLMFRLTESMNTSNSSRQRKVPGIDSQRERRKQIWENDFSPPERVFAPPPLAPLEPVARESVTTCSGWMLC